jgi:hypothetical protein
MGSLWADKALGSEKLWVQSGLTPDEDLEPSIRSVCCAKPWCSCLAWVSADFRPSVYAPDLSLHIYLWRHQRTCAPGFLCSSHPELQKLMRLLAFTVTITVKWTIFTVGTDEVNMISYLWKSCLQFLTSLPLMGAIFNVSCELEWSYPPFTESLLCTLTFTIPLTVNTALPNRWWFALFQKGAGRIAGSKCQK